MKVLSAINVVLWGTLVMIGSSLLLGIESQHLPGFPRPGQVHYYLYAPLVLLVMAGAAFAISTLTAYRRTALTLQILVLLCFPPFILPYTGGM